MTIRFTSVLLIGAEIDVYLKEGSFYNPIM